jgi:hypothetical protein
MQAHHFFTEGFGRASNHDEDRTQRTNRGRHAVPTARSSTSADLTLISSWWGLQKNGHGHARRRASRNVGSLFSRRGLPTPI